jgi:hypothetical protein
MARASTLYPPSPRRVPDDLTAPTSDYQLRVVLVLLGLIVFFGFYVLLVVGTALLIPINLIFCACGGGWRWGEVEARSCPSRST